MAGCRRSAGRLAGDRLTRISGMDYICRLHACRTIPTYYAVHTHFACNEGLYLDTHFIIYRIRYVIILNSSKRYLYKSLRLSRCIQPFGVRRLYIGFDCLKLTPVGWVPCPVPDKYIKECVRVYLANIKF